MKSVYTTCVLFLVQYFISHVSADVTQCYECNNCPDPFNSANATIQNCSTVHANGRMSANNEWDSEIKRKFLKDAGTTEDYVCARFMFEQDASKQNLTLRRCVARTVDQRPACEAITAQYDILGKVHHCYTCDSNLCNSGISLKDSIVVLLFISFLKILL